MSELKAGDVWLEAFFSRALRVPGSALPSGQQVAERIWSHAHTCLLFSAFAMWKQGPRQENWGPSSPMWAGEGLRRRQPGCVCRAKALP